MIDLNVILAYLDEEEDQQLMEDIFHTHVERMLLYAEELLGEKEEAEDIVATVFEKIVARYFDVVRSIKVKTDLYNYLMKATKNTCLNYIKVRQRVSVSLDELPEYSYAENEALTDDGFIDSVCHKMEYEDVLQALNTLPEKYRDALYYHFVMELTVADVAALTFQTVSATKQQLVRGKKMLLALLNK